MIIYMVYAIILSVHRRSVIAPSKQEEREERDEGEVYDEGVVNPHSEGYKGDEAEL